MYDFFKKKKGVIKIKIAIDLDEVVFPTYEVLNKMFFRVFGKEIDWYSFYSKGRFYMATEEGKWTKRVLMNENFYKSLVARSNAAEVLNSLTNGRNGYEVIYWTARPSVLNGATLRLLEDNRLPVGRIHYVNRRRAPKSKLKIVRQERINIVVESDVETIENLRGFCRAILFNTLNNGKCRCDKRIFKLKDLRFLVA